VAGLDKSGHKRHKKKHKIPILLSKIINKGTSYAELAGEKGSAA
jgi:hypothetical protein